MRAFAHWDNLSNSYDVLLGRSQSPLQVHCHSRSRSTVPGIRIWNYSFQKTDQRFLLLHWTSNRWKIMIFSRVPLAYTMPSIKQRALHLVYTMPSIDQTALHLVCSGGDWAHTEVARGSRGHGVANRRRSGGGWGWLSNIFSTSWGQWRFKKQFASDCPIGGIL